MARRKSYYKKIKKLSPQSIILSIIFLIIAVAGYYVYDKFFKEDDPFIAPKGELEFHFLELGNGFAGDCVYVKAGENDILIDAGSRTGSLDTITAYLNQRITDNKLEYVIVTHGHEDHIACFGGSEKGQSLFDLYEVEVIIDFPRSKSTSKILTRYYSERDAEVNLGAKHYTALECYNNQNGAQRTYSLSDDGNIKLEILYNYYYEHEASTENDYSVCVQFHHGSKKFLFTGDLEESGEEKLAAFYDFSQVELFKAGHHGSETSSNEILLKEIKPKICVACCCAGSVEYTDYLPKTFPSEEFYNRISVYTDEIYATSTINRILDTEEPTVEYTLNNEKINITNYKNGTELKSLHGNVTVVSSGDRGVYTVCTGEQVVLKETQWFKEMSVLWAGSPR